jgi:hypothetical protein
MFIQYILIIIVPKKTKGEPAVTPKDKQKKGNSDVSDKGRQEGTSMVENGKRKKEKKNKVIIDTVRQTQLQIDEVIVENSERDARSYLPAQRNAKDRWKNKLEKNRTKQKVSYTTVDESQSEEGPIKPMRKEQAPGGQKLQAGSKSIIQEESKRNNTSNNPLSELKSMVEADAHKKENTSELKSLKKNEDSADSSSFFDSENDEIIKTDKLIQDAEEFRDYTPSDFGNIGKGVTGSDKGNYKHRPKDFKDNKNVFDTEQEVAKDLNSLKV